MRFLHYTLAVALTALMLLNSLPVTRACGSTDTEPIYVSQQSPDLPFEEFTNGKIGIVRQSFGRKTLFIAYRYLNGGSFTTDEQNDLVQALKGTAPDENGKDAVKAWIDARKEIVKEEQEPPEIYTEREYGGYDFFPNCAKNAFEVAQQTLKDRAASYGAEDKNVRAWLAAQDTVFENCSGSAQIPAELGAESVTWLRKDRDYQIAAAHFYSLKFEEARARFEKIATDADSPWQEIAGYLVARTLIRQGSLGGDEKKKRELFEHAESRLQSVIMSGSKYAKASKQLLALVKYHLHPEERVVELGRTLSAGSNENLRQDLIDYVWLLDKFEERIRKAEEERQKKQEGGTDVSVAENTYEPDPVAKAKYERYERGETIQITFYEPVEKDSGRLPNHTTIEFKHDESEGEILRAFAKELGRALTAEETERLKGYRQHAVTYRQWRISPNRKWDRGGLSQYEGCYYSGCAKLTFDLVPDFLRAEDLSDWILTLQSQDASAYSHALSQWRKTSSPAWLVTALVKAEKSSPRLAKLMQAAETITRDDPAFPSIAYHLIRLKIALGQTDEARKRLDEIISWQAGVLPVSAQNQFLEQRTNLAKDLNEFLKSAQRKPAIFYDFGMFGKLSDLLKVERYWYRDPEKTEEEYEREREEDYKALLPWEDRFGFDYPTREIFDWHFSMPLLAEAARNPNVPDYLQRSLVLAVWTRAILLNNTEMAVRMAPEVVKVQPEMAPVLESYLKAKTPKARSNTALYILLKFPNLSPFVRGGLPKLEPSEFDYYYGDAWWCKPSVTEYTDDGKEIPIVVPKPDFLTAVQVETARREHEALAATGDAKSYLGKRVLEWAKSSPNDPRIPEALFITAQANKPFKNGCNTWEQDEKTKEEAETLLRERYPESPWTAKLSELQN